MKTLVIVPIIFLTLFASCKKDVPPVDTSAVTDAFARDTLYYIMNDWYLWYNLMPTVSKNDYPDPYKLLEAMRYQKLDRWSYILTTEEYDAQTNGTFVGHGFRIGFDGTDARIAMIYSNSPLYAQGVRRGWIVKTLNGTALAPVFQSKDWYTTYSALIQPSQAGITNTFVFKRPDGSEVTITSAKTSFTMNTVLLYETLNLTSGLTGHIVFESFFNPAPTELANAFAYFQSAGIKDLILDLRYNSGGDLYIAQTLASYIAGNSKAGVTFAKLSYNNMRQSYNMTIPFKTTSYAVSLSSPRLVVITTRSTASASEDVINSLKPFYNIVTIGDTTNGKPTGMNGWPVANKYFMFPVTFKVVNSDGQGDFFDGFIPTKLLTDDIAHDFNDRNELCLKEAIHYLETGSVSTTKSLGTVERYPQFSERPEWMNNAIIMK